jgi:hypothetical protein
MQEIAKATLQYRSALEERQQQPAGPSSGPDSNVVLNPDGTINMTAWDALATESCNTALSHLPEASNPSGTCICYNLPALDNVTGAFEADLRVYQLSTPSGAFSGIAAKDIQVGLSYKGASVSPVTAQTASKKVTVVTRQNTVDPGIINPNLKLLQTYLFVGQIDKNQLAPPLTT